MVAEKETLHRQQYCRLLLMQGDLAASTAWLVRSKAFVELPLPFSPLLGPFIKKTNQPLNGNLIASDTFQFGFASHVGQDWSEVSEARGSDTKCKRAPKTQQ